MRVFRGLEQVPRDFGPTAVTIGKFDGVHQGHRAVIRALEDVARAEALATVVVTFDRHPLTVLRPQQPPPALVSVEQKLELLAGAGVDATLLIPFTPTFAKQSADEFVRQVLVESLHARELLVGADFRYGANGAGDVSTLTESGREFGFAVHRIDDVMPDDQRRVSSSWIRELLAAGDVRQATSLLGHAPTLRGIVVHGAQRGRQLGYPTANLSPDADGLTPADGVYAGWLTDAGERYPAAISVGNNPTFEGVPRTQVEAYVLDRTLDLYDHLVDVEFVERIRGMVAFDGIEPLIAEMARDVQQARSILTSPDVE